MDYRIEIHRFQEGQKTPRVRTLPCGLVDRRHYNEQVFVREVGEKEKQDGLCSMRRGRTGDSRVARNNLLGAVCSFT